MDREKLINNLQKHGFHALWFETKEDAAEYLSSEIRDSSVGFGGSVTARSMRLYELLGEHNRVYWHWYAEDRLEEQKKAAAANVYILSANAISENGEIVNIDGNGNRLASAFYGHERVVFVIGVNKVVPDLTAAIERARNIASPLNARRLMRKTPCALSEPMRCHDCSSPERICSGMSILYGRMWSTPQMDVLLINEELGF